MEIYEDDKYYSVLSQNEKNDDLSKYIWENKSFFEDKKKLLLLIYKIAMGIKEIHSKGYVHGI